MMEYKILIIIIFFILLITYYNIIRTKYNNVKNAYSTLDIMLKKRYDLVPNLVNVVKGYAKHEKSALETIIKLRNNIDNVKTREKLFESNDILEKALQEINFLTEGYPDLKADKNFLYLQELLYDIEENISAARRTYNAHVTNYNNFIIMFPNNLFAKLFAFKIIPLFKINNEERKGKIWYNEK